MVNVTEHRGENPLLGNGNSYLGIVDSVLLQTSARLQAPQGMVLDLILFYLPILSLESN